MSNCTKSHGPESHGPEARPFLIGPKPITLGAWGRILLTGCLVFGAVSGALAQGAFETEGGEYPITGTLAGEQIYPHISLKSTGGYLVWHDNITDGVGSGVSARKINGSLSGTLSAFRVNQLAAGDQERPVVSLLANEGAAFVWQGGVQGFQHIYARFLAPTGWVTGDVLVNSATSRYQRDAAITTLTNGNVVVTWSSSDQAAPGSLQDVYFQILSPGGQKIGIETPVNQVTTYNQRSSAVAALSDGRFVVVWISEQQRFENVVDVYARIYSAAGTPVGGEFVINSANNICANPTVAPAQDGGFAVTWMERDPQNPQSWDVYVRPVGSTGPSGLGTTRRVNTWVIGDQLAPKIAALGGDYLVTWTSMAQDGSKDGVFGQFLRSDGALHGTEFQVNTTTVGDQRHPAVAADGVGRFLVVWTGFIGGDAVYDLFAQRYVNISQPLAAPAAPFVSVLGSSSLAVSWPPVSGLSVAHYEVFANGAVTASQTVTNTYWTVSGLAAASSHSYRLAYVLVDGRRSPLSPATAATTYGPGSYFGIPYEWMGSFNWGGQSWPTVNTDSDGDGMSNWEEFLAGTDPTDSNNVLRVRLQPSAQGLFLNWNTQVGLIYQVWSATSPAGPWTKVGSPRFAADSVDSTYVGGNNASFYRIERLR